MGAWVVERLSDKPLNTTRSKNVVRIWIPHRFRVVFHLPFVARSHARVTARANARSVFSLILPGKSSAHLPLLTFLPHLEIFGKESFRRPSTSNQHQINHTGRHIHPCPELDRTYGLRSSAKSSLDALLVAAVVVPSRESSLHILVLSMIGNRN